MIEMRKEGSIGWERKPKETRTNQEEKRGEDRKSN